MSDIRATGRNRFQKGTLTMKQNHARHGNTMPQIQQRGEAPAYM
uniref:Uncharacterized protein n=1 Tax=Sinorhizobium fredii (strain HH103) TaxID=1117943 RepID=A0A0A8WK67_SINF1|nr:hypothetical protein [Sinorhizobium fredii HH103]